MGIEVVLAEPQKALHEALYVEGTVSTLPRLTPKTKWAELKHVPIRATNLGAHDS